MTNSTQETKYYNNSTTSPAYINEVKRITPLRGDSYLACKAVLLDGRVDQPNHTYIDLNVKGAQAIEALESFEDQWPIGYSENASERISVFASIRIGSISAKGFLKQDKTVGTVLKGKLMEITYLKVGDNVVLASYHEQNEVTSEQATPEQEQSPTSANQETGSRPNGAVVHSTALEGELVVAQ